MTKDILHRLQREREDSSNSNDLTTEFSNSSFDGPMSDVNGRHEVKFQKNLKSKVGSTRVTSCH